LQLRENKAETEPLYYFLLCFDSRIRNHEM